MANDPCLTSARITKCNKAAIVVSALAAAVAALATAVAAPPVELSTGRGSQRSAASGLVHSDVGDGSGSYLN